MNQKKLFYLDIVCNKMVYFPPKHQAVVQPPSPEVTQPFEKNKLSQLTLLISSKLDSDADCCRVQRQKPTCALGQSSS